MGRGYDAGGYKCECIQGYEYPFEDPITYYDGQLLESEFWNVVNGTPSRYDMLKCRVATATTAKVNIWLYLLAMTITVTISYGGRP